MGLAGRRVLEAEEEEEDSKAVAASSRVTRAVGEAAGEEGEGGDVFKSALLITLFGALCMRL